MKNVSCIIVTFLLLTATDGIAAISPTKIYNRVKNKVTEWIYEQEEVIKQDISYTTQKKIAVQNTNGNITIKTWKQNAIVATMIKRAFSADDVHKISISIDCSDNDQLFIKTKIPREQCAVDFELLIPQDFAVQCATGKGIIKIKNCKGIIQATANEGSIELHHTAAAVVASINDGPITVHQADGPLTISSNAGNIMLKEVDNTVNATATNGSISMSSSMLPPTASISLTASGSIDLSLPENSSAHLVATSDNGSIISDHLVKIDNHPTKINNHAWQELKRNVQGIIGTGKADIRLHAQNGSIKILESEKLA